MDQGSTRQAYHNDVGDDMAATNEFVSQEIGGGSTLYGKTFGWAMS